MQMSYQPAGATILWAATGKQKFLGRNKKRAMFPSAT